MSVARTAAERGYLDIIEFLYERCDSNFFDSRVLHVAAVHGHLDIVKFLIENYDAYYSPVTLEDALKKGHHHVVEYLRASSDKQR